MMRLRIVAWCGVISLGYIGAVQSAEISDDPGQSTSAQSAVQLFQALAETVDKWDAGAFEGTALLPDTYGVWINLRLAGRSIGTAQATASDPEGAVTTEQIRAAAQGAMNEAVVFVQGDGDPVEREDRAATIAELPIALEMQVAQRPKRVRGNSLDDALSGFNPGSSGMLLRINDRYDAIFPGAMLQHGQDPSQAIFAALVRSDVGVKAFDAALADGSARLWEFDVLHLAQRAPGQAPAFKMRGSVLVRESAVNMTSLDNVIDELADHVLTHDWATGQKMLGTYLPEVDQYEPIAASAEDQALAALALMRFSNSCGPGDERGGKARSAALKWLADLAGPVTGGSITPTLEPGAAAIALLALRETKDGDISSDPDRGAQLAALAQWCRIMSRAALERIDPRDSTIGLGDRAAMAAALGSEAAMMNLWNQTPPHDRSALLPWLGWTQGTEGATTTVDAAVAGWRNEVAEFRAALWRAQIDVTQAGVLRDDFAGGFRGADGAVRADWQSMRALGFLAVSVKKVPAAGEEMAPVEEIVRLTSGARFAAQLSVRAEDDYRLARPAAALGAIRAAPWNPALPPAATALGLIALVDTRTAIKELASQGR